MTEAIITPGSGTAVVGGIDMTFVVPGTTGTRYYFGPRVGPTAGFPGAPSLGVGGVAGIETDVARGSGGSLAVGVRGVGLTTMNLADHAKNTGIVAGGQVTGSGCARVGQNGSVCLDVGVGPGHTTVRNRGAGWAPLISVGPSVHLEW
jgi:hypothetical protein